MSVTPGSAAPADEQQAQLLQCLRAAGGRPVSFEELRSLGIENPAVLCYELDLIGVPIARVNRYVAPGHAVPVGVRLDESVPPDYALEPRTPFWRRLRRQPSETPDQEDARQHPLSSAVPLVRERASEAARAARAQLESARAKRATHAQTAQGKFASHPRITPVNHAETLSASHAETDGAGRAETDGGGRAETPGASRAWGKGASLAGAGLAGASLAGAKGASLARAKAESLASATRPIAASAGRHKGPLAVIALAVAAATVIAIVLADQPGGGTSTPVARAGAVRHPHRAGLASHRATPPPSHTTPSAPSGEPRQLEAEGHQLLGEERYRAAIVDLRAAVARSGESAGRCLEPNTEACLTYAYALFDLGRALRLAGDRNGAVAALSERLRINDQHGAVQEELAKATAGGGASAPVSK